MRASDAKAANARTRGNEEDSPTAVHPRPRPRTDEEVESLLAEQTPKRRRRAAQSEPEEQAVEEAPSPERIQVRLKPRERFLMRGVDVPSSVWREKPFRFNPAPFSIGSERLRDRIYSEAPQWDSVHRFLAEPRKPLTYVVASEPSDQHAKYFAAWLVQNFLELAPPNTTVLWQQLYGGFENAALLQEPSLLVLTGLTPNSTSVKLEKARDLIEHHHNIPRIIVIAGEDPITFMATRLYSPVHSMYFQSSSQVKRKIDVE